ncbi:class I adenylate-forming enzyme family protein [Paraburkholderia tagetis]|uniref:Acyl--CoA ligase n=1 Tax=Paraburkholderia tagetis TaxID=2913261 RepID=A0A9X1RJQ9_9BURK|nr:class I adenylate-forming enzyme family protein [Paraburkholderia tagetis]MCG5073591.1 acyl--CoA ligase [Paraburkholderia tagetis]
MKQVDGLTFWEARAPKPRRERHFDNRDVLCFPDAPGSFAKLFIDAVAKNPHGDAVVCGDERLTWNALDERVRRVATGLSRRGVGKGDRVALLLSNRAEFVIAMFAVTCLGAIFVPMNIREQKPELQYVLNHCGAILLIHDADLLERLPASVDVPSLLSRISVGGAGGPDDFTELQNDAPLAEHVSLAADDTAAIVYTSGTTGRPKGAMLSGLGIVHGALHYKYAMELTSEDRSIAAVPLSHVTGLTALVAAMTACAGAILILREFKVEAFLSLAEKERMTHTVIVPAMYNLCLVRADMGKSNLSAWRIGGYGGAPMSAATIAKLANVLPGLKLMNLYGATETTAPATIMPPDKTYERPDSVGLPVACAEISIMNDVGQEVPAGESGEIWIKGPSVSPGYWNDAAATEKEFTQGYWHSGDIGSMDAGGYVQVLDRKKDLINRGGYKIYSAEVESVMLEHNDVVEAVVVGTPCAVLGERAHAFVTLKNAALSAEELRAFCAERLSDYKVPESFTILNDPLPRNANGKVLKRVLRDRLIGKAD